MHSQAFSKFIYISLKGITWYYGITEQSVISRHRMVVSRPLGGPFGSCALAAAFAAAFAASFTTWFSPREYITTGSYWVAMGYVQSFNTDI